MGDFQTLFKGGRIEWLTKLLEVASGIFCGSLSPQKVDKVSSRINQFMHDEKRDFLRHQMDDGTQLGKIVIHNFLPCFLPLSTLHSSHADET